MKNPLSTAEFFIDRREFDKAKIVLDLLKPIAQSIPEINSLGKLYADIREFRDTLELGIKILGMAETPQTQFDARVNVIRAHLNLNQPHEALELIAINEQAAPDDHPNLMDKAMALFLLDRKEEAEPILRGLLAGPHTADIDNRVRFNLGTYDLRNGNFKEGLHQVLLGGRKLNIWHKFKLPESQFWEGGELQPGSTVVVCAEGGIGDELISVRFMEHLTRLGMNPIWYTTRQDIARIFFESGFTVMTNLDMFQPDWKWTYSMALPVYLDLAEDQLWEGPYLWPRTGGNNFPVLPSTGRKKIGIKCMGNPKYDQDLHRTIPFEELVASIPEDYDIYSFHVDEDFSHPRVTNLKSQLTSWDATFDYINCMDLIVSSCTSLIHAAGAIGKDAIVIVPVLTYYTWAKLGPTTKWYGDNLKVLRQTEHDNWNAPLAQLKELLS